jgi:hypothetical protein
MDKNMVGASVFLLVGLLTRLLFLVLLTPSRNRKYFWEKGEGTRWEDYK